MFVRRCDRFVQSPTRYDTVSDFERQINGMHDSRSHHWLHQFQLVTEHSLKGATNYSNRATGVGTKHAALRPRPRPGSSGLETETETWTK